MSSGASVSPSDCPADQVTTPRVRFERFALPFVPHCLSTAEEHVTFLAPDARVWELYFPPPTRTSSIPLALRLDVHGTHVSTNSALSACLTLEGDILAWNPAHDAFGQTKVVYSNMQGSCCLRYGRLDVEPQRLRPIPLQRREKVAKVETGRGIVVALTNLGRVFLGHVTKSKQQKAWTHVGNPYFH